MTLARRFGGAGLRRAGFRGTDQGVAAYNPFSESGLIDYLYAEEGVATTGSDVDSWTTGVSGTVFAAGTASPSLVSSHANLNNQAAVLAEGGEYLTVASHSLSGTSRTMIVVYDQIGMSATQELYDSESGRWLLYARRNGNVGWFDGSVRQIAAVQTGAQVCTWRMNAASGAVDGLAGDTGEILRGETSLGTAVYTDVSIGSNAGVFARFNGSNPANAAIAAMFWFSDLDGDRDARVRAWAATKYGV